MLQHPPRQRLRSNALLVTYLRVYRQLQSENSYDLYPIKELRNGLALVRNQLLPLQNAVKPPLSESPRHSCTDVVSYELSSTS
jgi:hypothetical protein